MSPSSANGLTPFRNAQGMTPQALNIVRFALLVFLAAFLVFPVQPASDGT